MSNLELSRAQRLDQKVIELMPELSRSFAVRIIEDGKVSINGVPQLKAGYKMREGDTIAINYDLSELADIPEINLPVLYEDDDCVVVTKPVGVLSHSKGAFNPEATVATWLRSRLIAGYNGERGGIVHRLDRATSGVMICAKSPAALSWLQKQFSVRKVKKAYFAVIIGRLPHDHAVIDMPIERNPKRPQTFRVGSGGKPSVTDYRVVKAGPKYSLVELRPATGRTHQLRVHLKQLGHPIVGDTLYDGEIADRLYLHAHSLEITLPNRERKVFTSEVPAEFDQKVAA